MDAEASAFAAFLDACPEYGTTGACDRLRRSEFSRLDRSGHVYLDYTGGGLYAESQLREHHELLAAGMFGNPHSHNPTSMAATRLVERARSAVFEYFNADPTDYEVIFTQNASGALKLVGEAYPFGPDSRYLVSYDNHNSVNGIREFAGRAGAQVTYAPVHKPDLRMDGELVMQGLDQPSRGGASLFAYPAQSNFSGVQHPLELVDAAHERGWDVLLDCAAFVPTNRLDLSVVRPDFVPLSFYKMFGYPTGIGALIAGKEALRKLRRPWFAGGTITLASVGAGVHHLAPGHVGFEDGTLDYLGLPAVTIGLERLSEIGIDTIHTRVMALTSWLLGEMAALRHSNGAPLVRVFGPQSTDRRGSTIAFYLLDPSGAVFDVHRIEQSAGEANMSVRTGCFCNPGDGEVAHSISPEEMGECFDERKTSLTLADCQRLIEDATGKVPNTIRVSLGWVSDFSDVYRFREFMREFLDMDAGRLRHPASRG